MHGRVGGEGVCDRNSGEHSWVRVQGGMALGTARHGLVGHLLYGGRWQPATCRRTAPDGPRWMWTRHMHALSWFGFGITAESRRRGMGHNEQ